MPGDFELRGLEQFARLSKDLRAAGAKDLRRELARGIQRSTKPLKEDVKTSARQQLPAGVAVRVLKARITTRARAGKNPSVRLVAKEGKQSIDLASLDRGRLRHPLFGNRGHWYDQAVRPDWWTHPLLAGSDRVRVEIFAAIDAVARKFYT